MKRKWVIFGAILILMVLAVGYMLVFGQDKIWKWKVRRQAVESEIRAWGMNVINMTDPTGSPTGSKRFFTNAPSYLLNSYSKSPHLILDFDCVHLVYGGGLYTWGLTIGATNLPPGSTKGAHVDQWWPGIYFWNN